MWRVADPRWYDKAACAGAGAIDLFTIAGQDSESDPAKELRARNVCTRICRVREDCVIDAYNHEDTNVIRGGNRFVTGIGKSECMLCGTPAAKPGRLCFYCVHKRYCVSCDGPYATANADDEPGLCPACTPEQQMSRSKKAA